ncbi:MAG: GumC family protein [Planctomycetota bacterium]
MQIDPVRVLRQNAVKLVASIGVGLLVGTLAHFVLIFAYPLYSARVVFELAPAPEEVGSVIVQDQRTEEAVERLGQTEAARITSRELLERAMDDRDIEQTRWSQYYMEDGKFDVGEAVDDLIDEVGAGHIRRTNFFQLSWSAHHKDDVAVVLNRIADTYLQTRKAEEDRKFEQNRQTFQKQLDGLDEDLSALGRQLAKFVADNNLTSTSEDRNDLLLAVEDTARRINETKGFVSLAQSRKTQTEAKMEGRIEPTPDDIRTAEGDPQVQQANANLQDLRVAAESYRKRFGAEHTALRNLERQVRAAELERDATLDQILRRNLNADYKTYSDQVESYAELLEGFEGDLKRQEERLKEFTAAQQTVSELREKRERLLEARAKQLEILGNLDQIKLREDARAVAIATSAQTPRELSFPRLRVMMPLGAVLGLAAMLAFVFVREILDTRVRYATDLLAIPGLRVLGSIPELEGDPLAPKRIARVVRDSPKSVAAEMCRQVAGQIGKLCAQNGVKSIVCMSGLPEAGTTSFVSNLADSFAAGGRKVVVVDANFRRSRLAAAMGTEPDAKGLGDVLKGAAPLSECVRDAGGGVDILPAGTLENRVFEMLGTSRMDAVIAELSANHDVVIVDVPPAVVAGDGLAVANKVDGTVLVVRAFQEQRGLVNRMVGQLHDVRGQIVGAVLNRPTLTAGGYLRRNYEAMAEYGEKA